MQLIFKKDGISNDTDSTIMLSLIFVGENPNDSN